MATSDTHLTPAVSRPHGATLILSMGTAVLALNMFLPSLPHIAEEFGADYALVNLSIAGFLALSAVMQLVLGPLSDRYGRRRVMLCSFALFSMASLGCVLAQDIWLFLAFRLVQSAVIAGQVVTRAIIRDMYEPKAAAAKLGEVQMVMALAPILGPLLGGVLDETLGWRSSFWLYTGLGAAMFALLWRDLGETNFRTTATFKDQLKGYPELFRSRRFWGYSFCMTFGIGAFYCFITGAPIVARSVFDLSPTMLGFGLGVITLGYMAGNYITGRLAERVSVLGLIFAGRCAGLLGPLLGLGLFLAGQGSVFVFFAATIFVGLGNGLTTANATVGVMSVRPDLAGSASGLSGALVVGLGALLTTLSGAVVRPESAVYDVFFLLIACGVGGLLSVSYVYWVDLRDPLPAARATGPSDPGA